MRQIADFHIHSSYSRACSKQLILKNIAQACQSKGVDIVATGDFTHPVWFSALQKELEEIGDSGLYRLKQVDSPIKFILSTEVALIYKQGEKTRRLHLVVHAPSLAAVAELNRQLGKAHNLKADGRPILGLSAPRLTELCLKIDPHFLIYPAHIWTPWFSVFGSKSGFDSLEECFDSFTPYIYAFETGLSSDPEMNWRLSALDNLTLLSNSDAHSLANIGREANIFALEKASYQEIFKAIKEKDLSKIKGTIEFYPEEGMYHLDGHRACGVRLNPFETKKHKGICPKCRKPVVVGVLNRVEELADRPVGFRPAKSYDFVKLVGLDKIIAEALGIKSRQSKKVQQIYQDLVNQLGPELKILLEIDTEKIKEASNEMIAEGVKRVRGGKLAIEPGFDGQYGTIKIFSSREVLRSQQQSLFG
ncbi:DNA helicase UvrD [Candidatus Parcubacteria bacterium]|nr:MAG: DNA helicase UvrD [Candidatus Parcubacteria bacterium]